MAGLVPAIHAERRQGAPLPLIKLEYFQSATLATLTSPPFCCCNPWMAGTSPAMTPDNFESPAP